MNAQAFLITIAILSFLGVILLFILSLLDAHRPERNPFQPGDGDYRKGWIEEKAKKEAMEATRDRGEGQDPPL